MTRSRAARSFSSSDRADANCGCADCFQVPCQTAHERRPAWPVPAVTGVLWRHVGSHRGCHQPADWTAGEGHRHSAYTAQVVAALLLCGVLLQLARDTVIACTQLRWWLHYCNVGYYGPVGRAVEIESCVYMSLLFSFFLWFFPSLIEFVKFFVVVCFCFFVFI